MRVAFAGFRHGHIYDLLKRCQETQGVTITACAEDNFTARKSAEDKGVVFTHDSVELMMQRAEYDIVAIGDYYVRRGSIALEALNRGAHIMSDKPFCTSLDELNEIEHLATEKELTVGCMFDLRDMGFIQSIREFIASGSLGDLYGINFTARHPLLLDTRPEWYFEDNKYSGIFSDIGIHAFDLLPWLCDTSIGNYASALQWATGRCGHFRFCDGGMCLFTLGNGACVNGDVSYFAPDKAGFGMPCYWRFTFCGSKGQLEGGVNLPELTFFSAEDGKPRKLAISGGSPGGYFERFLQAIHDKPASKALTADNIRAQRTALHIQQDAHTENTQRP